MGVVNSMDDILKCLTTTGRSQHPSFAFDNRIGAVIGPTTAAGTMTSLWRLNKTNGANGKAPGDGAYGVNGVCNSATLGALPIKNATEGRELRLTGWEGTCTASCTIILYDRLIQAGPFTGADTSVIPINIDNTRYNTTGLGNEIWLEVFTAPGANSAGNCSVTYKNQNGEIKTTPNLPFGPTGTNRDAIIHRFMLADGDTGVLGLVSFKMNGGVAAGNFAILLVNPLSSAMCENVGNSFYRDLISGTPTLPQIRADACLAFAIHASAGGTLRGSVSLNIIEV